MSEWRCTICGRGVAGTCEGEPPSHTGHFPCFRVPSFDNEWLEHEWRETTHTPTDSASNSDSNTP